MVGVTAVLVGAALAAWFAWILSQAEQLGDRPDSRASEYAEA